MRTTRGVFALDKHPKAHSPFSLICKPVTPQTLGRLADRPIVWGRKPVSVSPANPAAGVLRTTYGLVAGMTGTGTHCTRKEMGRAAGARRSERMPRPPSNRGEGRGQLRVRPRDWGALNGRALRPSARPLGRPFFGRCAVFLPRWRRLRDGTAPSPSMRGRSGGHGRAPRRGTACL
jgi:hypothetical protein